MWYTVRSTENECQITYSGLGILYTAEWFHHFPVQFIIMHTVHSRKFMRNCVQLGWL